MLSRYSPVRYLFRYSRLSCVVLNNYEVKRQFCYFKTITRESELLSVPNDYDLVQKRTVKKAIVKEKGKHGKPKVELTDEEMMKVFNIDNLRDQLNKVLNKLKQDYAQHLSVHTSSGFIENILVKIDDKEHPLNQLGQVSRKTPQLIVINMAAFPEGLKPTILAIQESGMNLNPQQDGNVIYVQIPKLTKEHRENLAKNAKQILNKSKTELREIQNKFLKKVEKQQGISEDLIFNCQEHIKAITKNMMAEGEKIMLSKQKELLAGL